MELLVKVGNKRNPTDPMFEYDWRDGHIIAIRPDGYYTGTQTRKSHCVIRTQHDFWSLVGCSNYYELGDSAAYYQLKKYIFPPNTDGKWPFIEGTDISYDLPFRRRQWFIDFKRLKDDKTINKAQYDSIYDKSKEHNYIYVDRDLTLYLLDEDLYDRLPPDIIVPPGTIDAAGTYTVGTAQTYTDWDDAVADLPADLDAMSTPGNVILQGNVNETITESVRIDITLDTGAYRLTLNTASGVKHSGTAGTGHTIRFATAYDNFYFNGTNIIRTTVQDLTFNLDNSDGTYATNFQSQSSSSVEHIIERNIVYGDDPLNKANRAFHFNGNQMRNVSVRNNVIYSVQDGIYFSEQYSPRGPTIYNNTVDICVNGIVQANASSGTDLIMKNNLVQGSTTASFSNAGGGFGTTAYNVSEDANSPDVAYRSLNCHDGNSCFTNYGSNNYLLTSGGDELSTLDDGADLSGTFTDDVIGTTRSPWYIGASELAAAAGLDIPIAMHHYKMLRN